MRTIEKKQSEHVDGHVFMYITTEIHCIAYYQGRRVNVTRSRNITWIPGHQRMLVSDHTHSFVYHTDISYSRKHFYGRKSSFPPVNDTMRAAYDMLPPDYVEAPF